MSEERQKRTDLQWFSRQVDRARARILELQQRATDTYSDHPHPDELLTELLTAMEELQVGEEELQQQYEELEQAQLALERERRRYQELFQHAPDAYLVTNQHGDIQDANLAAVDLLGLEARLLPNKPIITFIDPEARPAFREQLRELLARGHIHDWETMLKPRHRISIDVAISAKVVYDDESGPVALRWLIRDITERKRVQRELQQLNETLEERVRERTAELEAEKEAREVAYVKEREARAAAERADALKLQFLGMISHELRTPLTSVKGFASTLLATDVEWTPEAQREFIETIDKEADRLRELVDQLLDLSRLKAGNLRIELEQTDLQQIVETTMAQLTSLTGSHRLVIELPDEAIPMRADINRIAQVIVNLVDNASKYAPPDSEIRLTTSAQSDYVEVQVVDDGPGIPEDFRDRVFEPFQQYGRSARTRKGAGLGLAICREIIVAHGGTIWLEDNQPGTRVCFTLPIAASDE